jgi:molybdenum cofactor cytidylyltransferase
MKTVGAVILAAGAASRMGQPKLLLSWKGRTILQHVIDAARDASLSPIVVVTGAGAEAIASALPDDVIPVENGRWMEGPGTSIAAGVASLSSGVDACIILLGDQPRLSAQHLRSMVAVFDGPVTLVGSEYDGVIGSPALFDRRWFSDLCALPPQSGARRLLEEHGDRLAAVRLPDGSLDIDTPADYERLVGTEDR